MATLFFIVFVDLVGFGMIIPVLPFYAERLGTSSSMVIFLFGLYSLGQLFGAPLWGALSDRIGRRPVLLATLAANAGANVLLALASSSWELGASRFVSGLAAGNISAAYAYLTDITSDADRPKALGMLGAAFGLGFILGPALGGILAGGDDGGSNLAVVAYAAAALSAVAFFATLFLLKESHGPEHRAAVKALPRQPQWAVVSRPVLRELLVSTMLVTGAVSMLQSTYAIFSTEILSLLPRKLGYMYAFVGVISVAVQLGAIGPLSRRFGSLALARTGGMLVAVALAIMPLTSNANATLLPLAIFGAAGALFTPSISTLITQTAAASERGAVMGVFQGASSLGRVIGPMMASGLAGVAGLRLPFYCGALFSLGGALLIKRRGAAVAE